MPTPKKKTVTRKRTPTVAQRREAAQIARREPGGRSLGVTGGPARAKAKVKVTAPKTPRKQATEGHEIGKREPRRRSTQGRLRGAKQLAYDVARTRSVPGADIAVVNVEASAKRLPSPPNRPAAARRYYTAPYDSAAHRMRASEIPPPIYKAFTPTKDYVRYLTTQVGGPGTIKKRRARKTIKRRMETRGR
jgi:hypothetical protein